MIKRALISTASVAAIGVLGLTLTTLTLGRQHLAPPVAVRPSPTIFVPAALPAGCTGGDRPCSPALCTPGEGSACAAQAPADPVLVSPTPVPTSAGITIVAGKIEAAVTWFAAGSVGVTVAVLFQNQWVSGASVTVRCTGTGYDQSASGVTAASSSWTSSESTGPQPPATPSAYFWVLLPAFDGKITCHGTASYNGLNTTF